MQMAWYSTAVWWYLNTHEIWHGADISNGYSSGVCICSGRHCFATRHGTVAHVAQFTLCKVVRQKVMERKILPPGKLCTLFRRQAREPNVVLRKRLTGFSDSYLLEARGLALVSITYFTLAFCGLSVLAPLYYSAQCAVLEAVFSTQCEQSSLCSYAREKFVVCTPFLTHVVEIIGVHASRNSWNCTIECSSYYRHMQIFPTGTLYLHMQRRCWSRI